MRYLPYVLVAFMAAPVGVWLVIEFLVLGTGSTTRLSGENLLQITTLGLCGVVALTLLGWWMSRFIARTRA